MSSQAKLPISVPLWRENAQNVLRRLREDSKGKAPASFVKLLDEAYKEATGKTRKG